MRHVLRHVLHPQLRHVLRHKLRHACADDAAFPTPISGKQRKTHPERRNAQRRNATTHPRDSRRTPFEPRPRPCNLVLLLYGRLQHKSPSYSASTCQINHVLYGLWSWCNAGDNSVGEPRGLGRTGCVRRCSSQWALSLMRRVPSWHKPTYV